MVLNDIIEQAAGRHSRASEHGGQCLLYHLDNFVCKIFLFYLIKVNFRMCKNIVNVLFLLIIDFFLNVYVYWVFYFTEKNIELTTLLTI